MHVTLRNLSSRCSCTAVSTRCLQRAPPPRSLSKCGTRGAVRIVWCCQCSSWPLLTRRAWALTCGHSGRTGCDKCGLRSTRRVPDGTEYSSNCFGGYSARAPTVTFDTAGNWQEAEVQYSKGGRFDEARVAELLIGKEQLCRAARPPPTSRCSWRKPTRCRLQLRTAETSVPTPAAPSSAL
jgi:hypothetical protein